MTDMQSQSDVFFVREQIVPASPPPMRVHGVWPWMRANLFGTIGDTILTIVGAAIAFTRFPFGRAEHEARLARLAGSAPPVTP